MKKLLMLFIILDGLIYKLIKLILHRTIQNKLLKSENNYRVQIPLKQQIHIIIQDQSSSKNKNQILLQSIYNKVYKYKRIKGQGHLRDQHQATIHQVNAIILLEDIMKLEIHLHQQLKSNRHQDILILRILNNSLKIVTNKFRKNIYSDYDSLNL